MTLPRFEIHRPTSVTEAARLSAQYGDASVFYCGGTELLLLMKLGFARYDHLIALRDIPELQGIRAENGTLLIGAATTHSVLERSQIVRERWPALARMERCVANIRVRTAGTLGGNLCFADPHSDPATFLLVMEATLACRHGGAQRVMSVGDFFLGPYQTALADGELLVEIRVPSIPPGAGIAHQKISFHERPAATVTCLVRVLDGKLAETRIAVGSVGLVPVRVPAAEDRLRGLNADSLNLACVQEAGEAAAEAAHAVEDSNGSPEYKRNLVRVLLKRSLDEALQVAAAGPTHTQSAAE